MSSERSTHQGPFPLGQTPCRRTTTVRAAKRYTRYHVIYLGGGGARRRTGRTSSCVGADGPVLVSGRKRAPMLTLAWPSFSPRPLPQRRSRWRQDPEAGASFVGTESVSCASIGGMWVRSGSDCVIAGWCTGTVRTGLCGRGGGVRRRTGACEGGGSVVHRSRARTSTSLGATSVSAAATRAGHRTVDSASVYVP